MDQRVRGFWPLKASYSDLETTKPHSFAMFVPIIICSTDALSNFKIFAFSFGLLGAGTTHVPTRALSSWNLGRWLGEPISAAAGSSNLSRPRILWSWWRAKGGSPDWWNLVDIYCRYKYSIPNLNIVFSFYWWCQQVRMLENVLLQQRWQQHSKDVVKRWCCWSREDIRHPRSKGVFGCSLPGASWPSWRLQPDAWYNAKTFSVISSRLLCYLQYSC